jgi:hypothetical protein
MYLGMHIVYKGYGTAEVMMRDYLEEAITESRLDVTRTAAMPA